MGYYKELSNRITFESDHNSGKIVINCDLTNFDYEFYSVSLDEGDIRLFIDWLEGELEAIKEAKSCIALYESSMGRGGYMTADNKKKKNSLTIDGKRLSTDRIAKAAFLQHMNDMGFNFDEFLLEIRTKINDMDFHVDEYIKDGNIKLDYE